MQPELFIASPTIGLHALANELKDFRLLPIAKSTVQPLLAALKHPQANADRIAREIKKDPAMTLRILFIANKILLKQDNEAQQLAHTVSLLGLPRVEKILHSIPTYETSTGYSECLLQALTAADLSIRLQLSPKAEQERYYLSALALNYLEQALWWKHPDLMQQRERLLAAPNSDDQSIEKALFGTTFNDLHQQLDKHWPLPKLAQRALAIDKDTIDTALTTINTQPTNDAIQFLELMPRSLKDKSGQLLTCHHLAKKGCDGWYRAETLGSQTLISYLTGSSLDQVVYHCHQSSIHCQLHTTHNLNSASRLLRFWDKAATIKPLFLSSSQAKNIDVHSNLDKIKHPDTTMPAMAEITASVKKKPQANNANLLHHNLIRLRRENEFHTVNQIFLTSMETLRKGLGIDKIALFILNSSGSELKTHYQAGLTTDHALRNFKLKIDITSKGVIQKLLQQPAGLHVTDANQVNVTKQLPALFSLYVNANSTALMSIFHQDKPLAIFYIDDVNLDSEKFKLFKQTCTATSAAIKNLAEHNKTKHSST
jgi:HD-like signal output (HDOD) protein